MTRAIGRVSEMVVRCTTRRASARIRIETTYVRLLVGTSRPVAIVAGKVIGAAV